MTKKEMCWASTYGHSFSELIRAGRCVANAEKAANGTPIDDAMLISTATDEAVEIADDAVKHIL